MSGKHSLEELLCHAAPKCDGRLLRQLMVEVERLADKNEESESLAEELLRIAKTRGPAAFNLSRLQDNDYAVALRKAG